MLPWQAQGWRSGRSASAGKRQMRHCSSSSSSSSSSYAGPAAAGSAVSGGAAAAITAFLPFRPSFFGGREPSFSKLLLPVASGSVWVLRGPDPRVYTSLLHQDPMADKLSVDFCVAKKSLTNTVGKYFAKKSTVGKCYNITSLN
jgi:hypothetical protein